MITAMTPMRNDIGRDDEKKELDRLLASAGAELVVVYGLAVD